jgi:hypothetical protein
VCDDYRLTCGTKQAKLLLSWTASGDGNRVDSVVVRGSELNTVSALCKRRQNVGIGLRPDEQRMHRHTEFLCQHNLTREYRSVRRRVVSARVLERMLTSQRSS